MLIKCIYVLHQLGINELNMNKSKVGLMIMFVNKSWI